MILDPNLRKFCHERDLIGFDAIISGGGYRQATRLCNIPESTLRTMARRVASKGALAGYSPEHNMTRPVPAPFMVARVSTNYNAAGEVAQQWVISKPDAEARLRVMMDVIQSLKDDIPVLKPVRPPLLSNTKLCNLYTFTDYHLGMLASMAETGTDWDLKKSQELILGMFEYMMSTSPAAGVGVINILGDFLHQDGIMPVTPTHGHILDSAARFTDIVRAALFIIQKLIQMALQRHTTVRVILAEGNHDITSSIWMREVFSSMYAEDPRVEIIRDGTPFYAIQHGVNMIAFHHGHLKKKENLPLLFAARYPILWGQTRKRYIHIGHEHHVDEKEFSGVKICRHPTLAPPDAHAFRGGYDSEREATVETYHELYGRVNRRTVTPEMLL